MSNWHSDIGKAGCQVVINLFDSNQEIYLSKEDHAAHVAHALKGLQFVYRSPDSEISVTSVICHRILVVVLMSAWPV